MREVVTQTGNSFVSEDKPEIERGAAERPGAEPENIAAD